MLHQMAPAGLLTVSLLLTANAFFPTPLPHHHNRHGLTKSTRRPASAGVIVKMTLEDDDIRYTMGQKHMETGFLKRAKAEPLYENPELLTADALNELYGPIESDNLFVIRSMWTASCIFRLDGIIIDSEDIQTRAWERVADSANGRLPSTKQVFKAMHVSPEVAVRTIFEWTQDEVEARALAEVFDKAVTEEFQRQEIYPIPGAVDLIADMLENEIPSAVISNLPLEAIEYVLEQFGLTASIEVIETFDGRLKTEGQLLLMACLEMERPPKHAVFFDFSAEGVDNAHDVDMRAVAYDGLYYQELEVTQCDAKLVKMTDWTMPRFRQLIEQHPFDEDFLTMTAMAAARAPIKRKVSVATYDVYRYEKTSDGKLVETAEYLETQQRRQQSRDKPRSGRRAPPQGSRFLSTGQQEVDGGGDDDVPELPDL